MIQTKVKLCSTPYSMCQISCKKKEMIDNMSPVMRKHASCICENKDADLLHHKRSADQGPCFHYIYIVQSLYFLNQKFQASRSSVVVQPDLCQTWWRNPEDRFSHDMAYKSSVRSNLIFEVFLQVRCNPACTASQPKLRLEI